MSILFVNVVATIQIESVDFEFQFHFAMGRYKSEATLNIQ